MKLAELLKNTKIICEPEIGDMEISGISYDSVSYTHLDVYKRQRGGGERNFSQRREKST